MAQWKVKNTISAKGKKGIATVRVGKSVVKVVFDDEQDNVRDINIAECPDNIRSGKWFISLSGKEDKIYSFAPVSGAYYMRATKIACPDGQLPSPTHISTSYKDNQTGKIVPIEYDAFTVLLEIMKGKDVGLVVPYFLRYNFAEVDGEVAFSHPKSKYTKQVQDFLDVTGVFDKGTMAFSDNILPALENRILEKKRLLLAIMKNGYIDSITETEDPDEVGKKGKKAKVEESVDDED